MVHGRRHLAALASDGEDLRARESEAGLPLMEFLLGRSLANNIVNAQLAAISLEIMKKKSHVDPALVEMEPDAGLGNGGLGRLAYFLDSMATLEIPGMGYGLRYEYGMFKQTIKDGWQFEQPDNWLRRLIPGKWHDWRKRLK